ncbi:MAG TPA: uracil-DNA glycosylase [Candidatus Nanoarchaeia archaeon]|nr:uracil-DNA glycosylase [Candidatus Nanoarchaeia archaeon]
MDKKSLLQQIAKEIEKCKICRQGKTGKAVPGEGNAYAELVFIGEAPGRNEAETGKPFIGRAGKLLRSIIKNIGIDEKEIFITNPVKYLPLKGTPSAEDIKHGKTHLEKQLKIINPKIIVLLGRVATLANFEEPISVKKEHGKIIEKNEIIYLITYHPSAALRFPLLKKVLEQDLKKLNKLVKISNITKFKT